MNDFQEALAQIARIKSVPFCYGCYSKAPSGRCTTCGSDDLMLEYPGCGVEYGLCRMRHKPCYAEYWFMSNRQPMTRKFRVFKAVLLE